MRFDISATATVVTTTVTAATATVATTVIAVATEDATVVTTAHRQNKKDDNPCAAIATEKTVVTRHSFYPLSSYTVIICAR